jgi:hypothetical protein
MLICLHKGNANLRRLGIIKTNVMINLFNSSVMVFNANFNNISVISWRSVLLVEETGVPGEIHRLIVSYWQTLSGDRYWLHSGSHKSKKGRQWNGQAKKDKMINSGLQKAKHKTEDWAARIPLKTRTIYFIVIVYICKNILKITIIWHNELFNGKGLKAKQKIFCRFIPC